MSALAEPIIDAAIDDDASRAATRMVLAVAQALAGGNNTVIVATASIIGAMLAPDKGLATLPITAMVFGMWSARCRSAMLARRYGRRFALQSGSVFGVLSGLISCCAVMHGSFLAAAARHVLRRALRRRAQSYRFAAADTASEAFRPKVVSWVLAGGVFAAVIGPQLVILTKDLLPPHLFAASYLGAVGLRAARRRSCCISSRCRRSQPSAGRARGRPLPEIARTPRFIVAVACGMASYAMMNMVMTSAPLAMVGCGHSVTDADARHPVARAGDVCAELRHRRADRALRRRARHRHRAWRCSRWPPRSASAASRSRISGPRWCCSASAGTSPSSAPPPW